MGAKEQAAGANKGAAKEGATELRNLTVAGVVSESVPPELAGGVSGEVGAGRGGFGLGGGTASPAGVEKLDPECHRGLQGGELPPRGRVGVAHSDQPRARVSALPIGGGAVVSMNRAQL